MLELDIIELIWPLDLGGVFENTYNNYGGIGHWIWMVFLKM